MDKIYYLDNAATTKMFEEEFDIIKENNINFYNPSASYKPAIAVRRMYENAREEIKSLLRGNGGKFIFTSSATESNNTVFEGLHLKSGDEVLISKAEHPAVYNSAHRLEKKGIIVRDIPLDSYGKVDFDEFAKLMNEKVALVSVMHVSNDVGAINDIKKLCAYAKNINKKVIFHSDGVQAFGKVKVNLNDLGVDLYSISAHKVYAPRGIAGLWIKSGVVIDPLLVGGGQEEGFRSSTENVSGALAFAFASKKAHEDLKNNFEKVQKIKDYLLKILLNSQITTFLTLNSSKENSSPYILSLSFKGLKGEVLMNSLVDDGVLISTGSACSSRYAGNRTLEAMGKTNEQIVGSVRISFSPYEDYDVDYIANAIIKNVMRFLILSILSKAQALTKTKATLISSDGWKEIGPNAIQFFEPLT